MIHEDSGWGNRVWTLSIVVLDWWDIGVKSVMDGPRYLILKRFRGIYPFLDTQTHVVYQHPNDIITKWVGLHISYPDAHIMI